MFNLLENYDIPLRSVKRKTKNEDDFLQNFENREECQNDDLLKYSFQLMNYRNCSSGYINPADILRWKDDELAKFVEVSCFTEENHRYFLFALQQINLRDKNNTLLALYDLLKRDFNPVSTEQMAAWGCACKAWLYNLSPCKIAENWNVLLSAYQNKYSAKGQEPNFNINWTELLLFQIIVDIYCLRGDEAAVTLNRQTIVDQCINTVKRYLNKNDIEHSHKSVIAVYAIMGILCYATEESLCAVNSQISDRMTSDWFKNCSEYLQIELNSYQNELNLLQKNGESVVNLCERLKRIVNH